MKKKKTVKPSTKATPKKKLMIKETKKEKKAKLAVPVAEFSTAKAVPVTVLEVLNHLLEVAKANLLDTFKQYVQYKIDNGMPALLEEFTSMFSNSFALHGITDTQLVNSLEKDRQQYLVDSAKAVEGSGIKSAGINTNLPNTKNPAPPITNQKAETKVQSEQASKIDPNEFSLTPSNGAAKPDLKVVEVTTAKVSVFSDLDVL